MLHSPGGIAGTAGQIPGTATNDNAAAGNVGQFVTLYTPTGSAVGLTSTIPANIGAGISLTAGDWDVSSTINFNVSGATGTLFQGGPSVVTATLPTSAGGAGLGTDALASSPIPITGLTGDLTADSGPVRVSIASTTTVFLVASAAFTVGTVSVFGTIRARRVR